MEIYRSGSIQNAAERLFVSRQGVSKMLRTLEEELGQLLFTRSPHGLVPTDYANAVLPHIRRLLSEYHSIESMRTLAAQSKSVVTVYALDHVFAYLGAGFLVDFHKAFPDIILSTVDTTDDAALNGLLNQQCNFAIVTGPLDETRFQGEKLFFSRYCARLHRSHSLAKLEKLTYPDLDGQGIVSKGRAYLCFRHHIDKYILLQGYHIDILAETADEDLLREMILCHHAINIGYDHAAVGNRHPDILMKEIGTAEDNGQDVWLVWDKTAVLTSVGRKFRKFLLEWLPVNGKDIIHWGE